MEEILHVFIGGDNYSPLNWNNPSIKVENKNVKYSVSTVFQSLAFIGESTDSDRVSEFLRMIVEREEEFVSSSAIDIQLWILVAVTKDTEQCNYSLTREAIGLLNRLNASVCIEYMTENNNVNSGHSFK